MRVIDLSMPIIDDHFRWPVERETRGDLRGGDQYQATVLKLSCHAFTHMDSRRHILADGPTLDDLPLTDVVGDCAVVDLSDIAPDTEITRERLAASAGHVKPGDIVLLRSCWDRQRSPLTPAFWTEAPYMSREASVWLLEQNIKAVAYDFPQDWPIRLSLEKPPKTAPFEQHVTHDILLRNGVTMIEYLCNTVEVTSKRTFLCALPLKIPRSDGAPARVVALEGVAKGKQDAGA